MTRLGDEVIASHLMLVGARRGEEPRHRFAERVAAAGAAGFTGIGWRSEDREREAALGFGDADVRAVLDQHGVALLELEALHGWWSPDPLRTAASRAHERALLDLGATFGARHLQVTEAGEPDGTFELDLAAERFAGVCDRGAEVGLLVGLEYLPWSPIPDPATALAIVERAGRPNGGVAPDAWHTFRGAGLEALRAVPGERVTAVQLDDADAERVGSWLDDTTRRRRLPGEGTFDLNGFLRTLADAGATCAVSVEVLSDELAALPCDEAARRAFAASRAVIDAALA